MSACRVAGGSENEANVSLLFEATSRKNDMFARNADAASDSVERACDDSERLAENPERAAELSERLARLFQRASRNLQDVADRWKCAATLLELCLTLAHDE
jgi:ABC-type transporter Mla subunit MlaD